MADSSVVSRWFGSQFSALHPALQALHLGGGRLAGTVEINVGSGAAGWLGRRLARSLGIPVDLPRRAFSVDINHTATSLLWVRRFDNGAMLESRFTPTGTWPRGFWVEETGRLKMHLTVDIVDGGWQWRLLQARFGRLRLPMCLFPRMIAGKRIADGRYEFRVNFSMPLLGSMLCYQGNLTADCSSRPLDG